MEIKEIISKNKYLILGLVLVVALFSVAEITHPYAFLKDDTYAQFLPIMIEGMNHILHGNLPLLTTYIYAGSPILEVPTYAVFYPPMFISYLGALALGDMFLTTEIFAFIHIAAGFVAAYFFAKSKGLEDYIAMLASLCFVFSGFVLIVGASWYYVLPSVFFLPLFFYLADRMIESNSLKWILISGIARGIYFYSCNMQFFSYTLMFELIYVAVRLFQMHAERKKWFDTAKKYFLALVLMAIIVLPLVFVQMQFSKTTVRYNEGNIIQHAASFSSRIWEIVPGSLLPYPIIQSDYLLPLADKVGHILVPNLENITYNIKSQWKQGSDYNPLVTRLFGGSFAITGPVFIMIYYAGTLFALFFWFGLVKEIKERKFSFLRTANPMLILGIIALLCSIGYMGIVWIGFKFVPIMSGFKFPFKFTLYTVFFICMFGAAYFNEKLYGKISQNKLIKYGIGILVILLLAYSAYTCSTANFAAKFDNPRTATGLPGFLTDYRGVALLACDNDTQLDQKRKGLGELEVEPIQYSLLGSGDLYVNSYMNGIHIIRGYEPFLTNEKIEKIPSRLCGEPFYYDKWKEYGVRWIFVTNSTLDNYTELKSMEPVYVNGSLIVLEYRDALPIVFEKDTEGYIKYDYVDNGLKFDTDFTKNTDVVVNLFYSDHYKATSDGKPLDITKDEYSRMVVEVPAGSHTIKVLYTLNIFVVLCGVSAVALITYAIVLKPAARFMRIGEQQ